MLTYRIRRYRSPDNPTGGYRVTFEVLDEATAAVLAKCELNSRAAQSVLEISASDGTQWTSIPNRRVMRTQWALSANGEHAFQFDSRVAGKLLNPLYRTSIAVRDARGAELFSVVDPRKNILDRVLGCGPGDWVLLREGEPIGKIAVLPKLREKPSGLLGKLKSVLAGSDRGIVSFGGSHALPAPAALSLLAIHEELTDASTE